MALRPAVPLIASFDSVPSKTKIGEGQSGKIEGFVGLAYAVG
jgi:hypothetical protein